MSRFDKVHALLDRIQTLEKHAMALQRAFINDAMRQDAAALITSLHQAEAWLQGVPSTEVVAWVEDALDRIARRLSNLGRTT